MAVIVGLEMRLGGGGGSGILSSVDGLDAGGVRSVAAEPGLEGVSGPVGQQSGHAGCAEAGVWRV